MFSTSSNDLYGDSTILMVDDEDLILTMGQTVLSEYGYKVLIANMDIWHWIFCNLKEEKSTLLLQIWLCLK
jgi:DNA-binding response OmpR family regulator